MKIIIRSNKNKKRYYFFLAFCANLISLVLSLFSFYILIWEVHEGAMRVGGMFGIFFGAVFALYGNVLIHRYMEIE